MKNLETTITIDAPTNTVWAILMQHENYPEWNPFIKQLSGNTNEGSYLSATIHPEGKSPMEFKPKVLVNQENKEFRWVGKLFVKGLFDGEHYFILEEIDENKTRFIHGEKFTGLMVAPLMGMIEESTLKGFNAMNLALKERAEKVLVN